MQKSLLCRLLSFLLLLAALPAASAAADRKDSDDKLVIAQISDTHLGLARAPDAADNLRKVVNMVNQRHPDAVLVTGDIGENPEAWAEARGILQDLQAKSVFYIPGNHDVNAHNLERWRSAWGPDYKEFHIKWLTIFGLDSQLLGNYDNFDSHSVVPLSSQGQAESKKMLDWFAKEIDDEKADATRHPENRQVVLVMQHVPVSRADGGRFPNDPKPYWTVQEPYRSGELELLRRLGVRDVIVGHWHIGMVYDADGITYHVAPAVSWSAWEKRLGFAMHTINRDGRVHTDFVYIPGADPHWP